MTNERAQRLEDMAYSLGFERGKAEGLTEGYELGKQEVLENFVDRKTKTIKYYDEDENVWKVGEVIVDE